MAEPDDCIEVLDEWIKTTKNVIYDENIKGPNNQQGVLEAYTGSLEQFANKLIRAIESENIKVLTGLGLPDDLMKCIRDLNTRTVITYRIEHWFIRYPFVKSKLHINELEAENAGVN